MQPPSRCDDASRPPTRPPIFDKPVTDFGSASKYMSSFFTMQVRLCGPFFLREAFL